MDPQREDRDNPLDRKARNIVGAHWLEEPGHSYTTWSSAWINTRRQSFCWTPSKPEAPRYLPENTGIIIRATNGPGKEIQRSHRNSWSRKVSDHYQQQQRDTTLLTQRPMRSTIHSASEAECTNSAIAPVGLEGSPYQRSRST